MSHAIPDSYFVEFSMHSSVTVLDVKSIQYLKASTAHRNLAEKYVVMNNLKGTIYKD